MLVLLPSQQPLNVSDFTGEKTGSEGAQALPKIRAEWGPGAQSPDGLRVHGAAGHPHDAPSRPPRPRRHTQLSHSAGRKRSDLSSKAEEQENGVGGEAHRQRVASLRHWMQT